MSAMGDHWRFLRAAMADERQRGTRITQVRETAFLPAALEVIERPVSPTGRLTTWCLLGGLALLLAWLTFGAVDIVATAQGRLIPAGRVQLVQPAEAGVIRRILVRDGQEVRKGQPLVLLDPTISSVEATQAKDGVDAADLAVARARAVLTGLEGRGFSFVAPPGIAVEKVDAERRLARAQFEQLEAEIAAQGSEVRAARAAAAEASVEAAKLAETLPLLDEQLRANETLLEKGYVSKLRVVEMRRQRLAAVRDREAALNRAVRARASSDVSASGAVRSRAAARSSVLATLVEADTMARVRREELAKTARRSRLQTLVAPVDGVVAQLAVHTEGGVVEAAKPIMTIVPSGGHLLLEARLLNRDAGFVHPGQPVTVKVETFPFTRYGSVPGRVISVGADAVDDAKLGPVYPALIRLDRMSVEGGAGMPLRAGMNATADVKTGRRSLLSYLLSPIEQARLEAARER